MSSTRLLVVDDHNVIREGLKALVKNTEMVIAAEAVTGGHAIELISEQEFDLVILDVRMRDEPDRQITACGLSLLSRMKLIKPELPILMFSAFDNPTYVSQSASLGACGYVLKSANRAAILESIRAGARGENSWTREEMRRVAGALSTPRISGNLEVALTQREYDVLNGLVQGKSNKEIAKSLEIGYETVKEHVQHILRKAGVSDRTQAAIWAVRKGVA